MNSRRLLAVLAAVAMLVATMAVPNEAQARNGRIAAGILGGIAAGALIGSAFAHPYYGYPAPYYYGPAYYPPPPAYYYGGPAFYPTCYWQRRPVWTVYGWRRIRVRVCY